MHTEKAHNASVASTGVALSYVAPANRCTKVVGASFVSTAGALPTIALQAILGGVTVSLNSLVANGFVNQTLWLQPGDTVQWNVTVVGAAGTADLTIACEDWESQ